MSTELLVTIVGALTTIFGSFLGWLFGKKRQNAELASMQLDYIKKLDDYYVEKIESLMLKDKEREVELSRINQVLKALINTICIRKVCPDRMGLSPEEMLHILQGDIPLNDILDGVKN